METLWPEPFSPLHVLKAQVEASAFLLAEQANPLHAV
jgi:hypothetical protein